MNQRLYGRLATMIFKFIVSYVNYTQTKIRKFYFQERFGRYTITIKMVTENMLLELTNFVKYWFN